MRKLHVPLVLMGLFAAAPLSAQAPEPLADLIADWEAAFNSGNAAAVAALYTEDAIRIPPDLDFIRGPEEITAGVAGFAGFTISLRSYGGLLEGDVGTSWGSYELSGTVEGQAVTERGRWMNAVKKTADGWKILRDIWNRSPEM